MKSKIVISILLTTLIQSGVTAKVYFVNSQVGNDNNNGRSITSCFKTLQRASDISEPGDIIKIMKGSYSSHNQSAVLNIYKSGSRKAPITFECYNKQPVTIQLSRNNWQGINVAAGTNDIVINGFHIVGINQVLTWNNANQNRVSGLSKPDYNGTGIACSGTSQGSSVNPVTRILIENCIIHDCAQAGITTSHSDNITIKNNIIFNCCWYSPYDSSGISNWEDASVHKKSSDNQMKIVGNTVYSCRDEIGTNPSPNSGWTITDGNGIIVDDAYCEQTTGIPYAGRTLIAHNLIYNCGGAGIRAFNSNSVNIINNTTYHNAQSRSYADTNISCGNITYQSSFLADTNYLGGAPAFAWNGPDDESLVAKLAPIPVDVLHYERKGIPNQENDGFTYTIHEVPLRSYKIVLLFTEDHWNKPGQRQFNVSVNGNSWLSNFDIFAASGAEHKAVAEVTHDTSDPNGDIRLVFSHGRHGNPKIDGIEVLSDQFSQADEIDLICVKPSLIQGVFHILNNIIFPNVGTPAIQDDNITTYNILTGYNIYYNGSDAKPYTAVSGKDDLWVNPQFQLAGISAKSNFHLEQGSPAIGSGLNGGNRGCYSYSTLSK